MSVLQNLEPKNVYRFFEQMCAIPHGSRNTKAISDWCVSHGSGDWSTIRMRQTM